MILETFGKKLGMTQVYDANANFVGVTVIEVEPACILEKVTYPKGVKVKIGCFKVPEKRIDKVKRPIFGFFKKCGVDPYKLIREVDIEDEATLELKKEIGIDLFQEGTKVTIRAKSKGRGFQGGMKRWGWAGQPDGHGHSTHRRIGSVGQCTYPARIFKGLHMPGHMGDRYITVKNLKVIKVDKEKSVIFVEGAVPGARNAVVSIKKVIRK